jgi:hypothetical protein
MAPWNLTAYCIYGLVTYVITVRVGWLFHQNGYYFIREELKDDQLATSVNNLLLACYYLTNLGYITLMIWFWAPISSFLVMVEMLCSKVAYIVLMLGCLHFINMTVIYLMRKKQVIHQ